VPSAAAVKTLLVSAWCRKNLRLARKSRQDTGVTDRRVIVYPDDGYAPD
jgi:hypothetical protein